MSISAALLLEAAHPCSRSQLYSRGRLRGPITHCSFSYFNTIRQCHAVAEWLMFQRYFSDPFIRVSNETVVLKPERVTDDWVENRGKISDFSLRVKVRGSQGRSQDFTLGAQKLSAKGARMGIGEGVSPSPTDYGVWSSVTSSPVGSWAEPRPPTHFWHIWGPQNTFGRENSPNKAIFSLKNPLNRRLGGMAPCLPSGYAPGDRHVWVKF